MDIFEIFVHYDSKLFKLGSCDADHVSVITLLHTMSEKQTGCEDVPTDEYCVWVVLPWCSDRMAVNTDSDLVDVFKLFSNHGKKSITFEVEKKTYIPLPPEASTNIPNEHLRFIVDNQNTGFTDFENNLFDYEGDNEDAHGDNEDEHSVSGDSDEVIEVDSGRALAGVDEDEFGLGHGSDDFGLGHGYDDFGLGHGLDEAEKNINLELFEGYNSHPDDEFVNDSEAENMDSKMARLIKTNPFKQLLGTPIEFEVGQTHDSVYSLRALLTDYAIQEGFNFKKVKNDRNRLTYACQAEGCPWRLHASNLIDDTTMQIKTYTNEHLCHRLCRSKEAKAKWIVSKFGALVKSNPDIRPGIISDLLRDQFNVTVDAHRLYNAKKRALQVLLKEHEESFKHIRKYAIMVQQCNPGSAAYLHLLEPTTFQRFFLSFEAQKKGFMDGCRPFIGIDGCHLKGPYGGVLLSAVALDANNGLFPLACCVCEGETLESWSWFLVQLRLYLKYPAYKPICFMSDRQKGVIGALKAHWPHASIRYCARHIYANFRTPYSGQKLKQLFWKASKSYDVHEFKKAMRDIGLVSMKAQAWLCEIKTENWCRHAFDPSIKCDHVTNNMTEAFNSMLKDFRGRTYLNLLEFIRRMVMTRFQVRKEGCGKWKSEIPPTVNKKIVENSADSRILQLIHAGEGKYELMGLNRAYTANLQEKTCECGAWQISGVPCSHALAGIRHFYGMGGINEGITQFIHPSLSKSAFLRSYSSMINPIPDFCVWVNMEAAAVDPPPIKNKPGRPKLIRKRESHEKPKASRSGSVICTKCKNPGHNKRTCKAVITSESNKRAAKDANKSSTKAQVEVGASSSQPPTQVQTQLQSQVTM